MPFVNGLDNWTCGFWYNRESKERSTTGDREGKKGQPRDVVVPGGKTADKKKKKVTFLLRTDE